VPCWQLVSHLGVQDILLRATALVGIVAGPDRPPFVVHATDTHQHAAGRRGGVARADVFGNGRGSLSRHPRAW